MKRLLCLIAIVSLAALLPGCGNIFIHGAIQPGFSTVSGAVSAVQLSVVVSDNGTMVSVTFVTLVQSGTSSTIGFCGDQVDLFPLDQTIRADFNPGPTCASVLSVVIA